MVHIFYFLPTRLVFEIVNPFSWIFNGHLQWEKLPDSDAFPDLLTLHQVRTLELFPPTESWLVNSNFPRASRMQGIVWSSGGGQFMWFIKAPSISSPKFWLCCSRSFSSMIFKMAVRGEKTLQRLLLQNLHKSWRFISRDLMRSSKQNGGKRFARIFLKPLKHYAGMAS